MIIKYFLFFNASFNPSLHFITFLYFYVNVIYCIFLVILMIKCHLSNVTCQCHLLCYFSPIDEDAPVQGPLPYEPDDAPWKKSSESGMRKL